MSILCYNCRGLGEAQAVADLRSLIRRNSPKIVFLSETKRSGTEMEVIRRKMGDFFGVYVHSQGRAVGLALLWDRMVQLSLCYFSAHHMDATVRWGTDEVEWRFTGVYGWPEMHNKSRTESLIAELAAHSHLSWIVGGTLTRSSITQRSVEGPGNRNHTLTPSVTLFWTLASMIWALQGMNTHGADGIMGGLWSKNGWIGYVQQRNGRSYFRKLM